MSALRAVRPDELRGGLRATGSHPARLRVQAFCQCGWTGHPYPWDAQAGPKERAELAAHLADSGHQPYDTLEAHDGYHGAYRHFHDLNDCCPLPADSYAGRLERITAGGTLGDPIRSLDRLAAVIETQAWLVDQEAQAIIGARMAHCTWDQIGQAIGADRQNAIDRWGATIARYEHAGLLDAEPFPDTP